MSNMHNEATDKLFEAILDLQSIDDCYNFFEDLCTAKELDEMTQRLKVAFMLYNGDSYQSITQQVNVSTATISRVSRCLRKGKGGYRRVMSRVKKD